MLRAIMIDGFGWFREPDFRRAWLLFDTVEYVFPGRLTQPAGFPAMLRRTPEYVAVQPTVADDHDTLRVWLAKDLATPEFVAAVDIVPEDDVDYTLRLVQLDGDLADLLPHGPIRPAAAFSLLTSKLLLLARQRGAVPIVGKDHAWRLLAAKSTTRGPAADAHDRRGLSTAAIAAGLSLRMLDGEVLLEIPIERLQRFKTDQRKLLDQHQLRLLSAGLRHANLPLGGAAFDDALEELRLECLRERAELDDRWQQAWTDAGFDLAKKAVVTAAAAGIPALTLFHDGTGLGLLRAAVGPAMAAGGAIVAELLDIAKTRASRPPHAMAYLFEAQRLFNDR